MDQFLLQHGLYKADSTDVSAGLDQRVPDALKGLLKQAKANSYAKGFFKFIVPDQFRHYFALWHLPPTQCVPFIKFAFGQLIFYYQEQYNVLNPVYNCIDMLGGSDELDFVMNIALCDRQALENSFFIDVYDRAFERLGAPGNDEMYAFVPALGLGGNRDAANVQRVRMEPQMMILAQL